MKMNRLTIPPEIRLKLWVLSGGRCEIPGCNKYVWRHGVTLQEDNFAHIAHIVAASPKGPRGDEERSPKLVIDFDNLMLVCLECSKLIDGKNCEQYTEDDLKRYKKAHEDRVRIQTDLKPEMQTTVLRFMANIGDRPVTIGLGDTYQAILQKSRFPRDERGILLDNTNRPGRGEPEYWSVFAKEIKDNVEKELRAGNTLARPDHLSIFALGPIPLLMQLGNAIGNAISADLYQRHRDSENWKWKEENDSPFDFAVSEKLVENSKHVVLVLSLSGKIGLHEVYNHFEETPHLYEISIDQPNPGFLTQESHLQKFKFQYRSLLSNIREKHGEDIQIHLFPAIPAPIAVLCGRELLPKVDPPCIVYDYESEQGGFIRTIQINK